MKRFTTLLALALILSLGAGVTYAAKGDKAAAKAAKAAKGDKAGKKDGIMGTVVKADDKSITVQTRGKKGAEVTVAIDASTKFEGVATVADIKPGQHIMATPNVGTATKVTVQAGKGDRAGKKAAKKAAK